MKMATFSRFSLKPSVESRVGRLHGLRLLGVIASTLWLGGCAVEVENTQAAQEVVRLARPPGSVYTGWRVFQDRCALCHGPDALGTANAPNLLPIVGEMGTRRFVSLVLTRYDWGLSGAWADSTDATRRALVEGVVQRRAGMLTMPAWQEEPSVNAHIVDLHTYLSARSDGTQGTGRPAR
jgi:mono/diheme cytochrome c family protein